MAEQPTAASGPSTPSAAPTCPNCGAPVVDWRPYGRCKQCKEPFSAEFDAQMDALRSRGRPATPVAATVVVTDIQMPFGSMVVFMVKWTLASIPALIILALLAGVVLMLFGGLGAVVGVAG
jgi:hypothetical protein